MVVPILTRIKGKSYNAAKFQATSLPQPTNVWHNKSGGCGSFGGSGDKGASNSKGPWGQSKDVKADFKGLVKSTSFDKNVKRERSISDRNYDSWNTAKKPLFADEFNSRRKDNVCINCDEVGHRFNGSPKPKP